MAIPHNSKCRYGERGAAAARPKAQIILDAAKVSAASGGNSEPKQGQRSQSARGFCPRSTMRKPQPDIIEHFGNADAVPQLPERCLSRKAGIVRCCLRYNRIYCRPLSGTIPKGRHLFSGWRAHDVRPLRGARQITADFYGKIKSPHPYGCGPEKLKRSEITYSSLHPGGRADPRRRAYTGCRGHGHTCRSRGGSCRGLPPTADGRGRGGYSPQSRCRGKRAGSR